MAVTRFALWLLTRASAPGGRDALIGDLIEEIGRGRSPIWVCQEVIGLYGLALIAHARTHVRLTPLVVALALCVVLLGGASIASLERVVETWTSVYYLAGITSLFAHVMSRSTSSRPLLFADEAGKH